MVEQGSKPDSNDPPLPTDGDLARRVVEGDRAAADELVRRHQAKVRSFLLRLCGDRHLADDLAQDTLVNMLRYADRYDDQYAMRTWLLTMARRLWINHLRKKGNQQVGTEYQGMASQRDDDPAHLAAKADDARALRDRLEQAMTHLSDNQRTAVALFHQQDMSLAEVAEVMGIPENTVKSHLHRGRAALRNLLGPSPSEIES